MDDLVEFLRARLDHDEQVAREATVGPWRNAPTARRHLTASGRSEEAVFAAPPDTGALIVATTGEASERRNLVNAEHIARHDPARVLAEVEAKRRIVRALESAEVALRNTEPGKEPYELMTGSVNSLRAVVQMLASVYADHPDYRAEWRP
ncbi:DUF6221 family protein [Streptomyces misionensis]|uniref:DUF6221 family protein n=1 Tax=Streptomyces misionensis TaxID=67331 RepID=UPI00367E98BE